MMMNSLVFLAAVCLSRANPVPQEIHAVSGRPPYLSKMGGQGHQVGMTGLPIGQTGGVNGQSEFNAQNGLGSGQPPMGGAAPQQQ
ncbi:hypothetical protein ANCCAN_12589 [Ancylostoma caninum]|uniref:Uncharacterized protein n=1 Tax=Ancylostoma caninum TaxID=29170 RepID=A0A368GEL6_ANCCA|nr:hypothetical protein ANCCAN_12589 [Ancylostoma caninum]